MNNEQEIEIVFKLGKKKIRVKNNEIFYIPDKNDLYFPNKDNPLIFYIWNSKLPPAIAHPKYNLIFINLHSLSLVEENMIKSLVNYLSAVLLEELTHLSTNILTNHDNWIKYLFNLQESLDNGKSNNIL